MNQFFVISGCSGGGKSTLLAELKWRGFAVVEEPGRRVVAAEMGSGGMALPWIDMVAFVHRVIRLALDDLNAAQALLGPVFFDRGLVDALSALASLTKEKPDEIWVNNACTYHRCAFMIPPWPEIYVQDSERRHDFKQALSEYNRLIGAYPAYGYDLRTVPKLPVSQRADFILDQLNGLSQ
ncbi:MULTISPECIES: AAA family ATPase [unclassified Herbaspirillum]|uniref:AAA family ATPase n=1 Tax=unclassified Herbaspirillum TaxID=2624150 RepID=UPI000C09050C|nr:MULTISPECIES: AAA family ATPase [unclassified Herbaspirillum]MAF02126.1 ATPase [Herbaspirillum sp.]|tara:strand:- start:12195 stop:12737 length:543 start_codon:yes stop_codon:yes gene_type:complete